MSPSVLTEGLQEGRRDKAERTKNYTTCKVTEPILFYFLKIRKGIRFVGFELGSAELQVTADIKSIYK